MGGRVKTQIPERDPESLGEFNQGEIFYYPYARENWMLLSALWHNSDTTTSCEVIAEGANYHGIGRVLRLSRYRQVYRCNEMEALAWASK